MNSQVIQINYLITIHLISEIMNYPSLSCSISDVIFQTMTIGQHNNHHYNHHYNYNHHFHFHLTIILVTPMQLIDYFLSYMNKNT